MIKQSAKCFNYLEYNGRGFECYDNFQKSRKRVAILKKYSKIQSFSFAKNLQDLKIILFQAFIEFQKN